MAGSELVFQFGKAPSGCWFIDQPRTAGPELVVCFGRNFGHNEITYLDLHAYFTLS